MRILKKQTEAKLPQAKIFTDQILIAHREHRKEIVENCQNRSLYIQTFDCPLNSDRYIGSGSKDGITGSHQNNVRSHWEIVQTSHSEKQRCECAAVTPLSSFSMSEIMEANPTMNKVAMRIQISLSGCITSHLLGSQGYHTARPPLAIPNCMQIWDIWFIFSNREPDLISGM